MECVRLFVLSALAGLSLLASACGGSSSLHAAATATLSSAESAHRKEALAYARCMRTHGVPDFPDPDPQGDLPPFRPREAKQIAAAADGACKHLLSSGGNAGPQQRQQKLAFGVKVAQCLRAHGYPNFPDPTSLGQQNLPPGIEVKSPQFQAVEASCEKQAQKALGVP
jgi:hypothetical protein